MIILYEVESCIQKSSKINYLSKFSITVASKNAFIKIKNNMLNFTIFSIILNCNLKYCVCFCFSGIMTQRISQLKPGRNYVVQVTVRKLDGKALSYDLLQVQTKPICKENNTI